MMYEFILIREKDMTCVSYHVDANLKLREEDMSSYNIREKGRGHS